MALRDQISLSRHLVAFIIGNMASVADVQTPIVAFLHKAWILFSSSAVTVYISQVNRDIEMVMKHISLTPGE